MTDRLAPERRTRPFKDQSGAWRNGTSFGLNDLARIVHERFRYNRGFAATTSLDAVAQRPGRRARGSVGQHTVGNWHLYFWRLSPSEEQRDRHAAARLSSPKSDGGAKSLAAPRACLASRLRDFATNRHE